MSDNCVKIFDEYHTVCQNYTLPLKECNTKFSTNFVVDDNLRSAWEDYETDYELLKLQENVVEGEWLSERMDSFKEYMNKYQVNKPTKKKFFISTHSGVTKVTEVLEKVTIPDEALDEEEELELEQVPTQDAFQTPTEEIMQEIKKKQTYGKDFLQGLRKYSREKDIDLSNYVIFIPTEASIDNTDITETIIRKHLFPDKDNILESLKLWKESLNVKNKMYDASDLFVLNIDEERVKINRIPYIFKDVDKYYRKNLKTFYNIRLIGQRTLHSKKS